MKYGFNVDDIIDDLWHELQEVADDSGCHRIVIDADDKVQAANRLSRLLTPFFFDKLEEHEDEQ